MLPPTRSITHVRWTALRRRLLRLDPAPAAALRLLPDADNRFDREHVAEEIEDLGKSERDAVRSQIRRILEHFFKLAYSPAGLPRFDWMATIADARSVLGDKMSTTLRQNAEAELDHLYRSGRRRAELAFRGYAEDAAADRLPAGPVGGHH